APPSPAVRRSTGSASRWSAGCVAGWASGGRCGTSSPAPGRISPPAPAPWYCPRPELGERLLDELVLVPPPEQRPHPPARPETPPLGTSSTSSMMAVPGECAPPARVLSAHPPPRIRPTPITIR